MVVDVEITSYPRPAALPRGRVVEILGRREDFGVDVEIVIRKFHLPHRFPPEVLAEAGDAPQYIPERDREGRRDFRDLPIVTIDGETAKDFDDAVLVERRANGNYLLHVHIADVAHYVRARHGARPRGAAARHFRLFSRPRRAHAAAGALQRHLQPQSPRRSPGDVGADGN